MNETTINYENGDKYVGSTQNGKPYGKGTYIWKDGSSWNGTFKNGIKEGLGVFKESASDKPKVRRYKNNEVVK